MARSAGELYEEAMQEGADIIDAIRFHGLARRPDRAAKRLEKLLNKFEKAWIKQTAQKKAGTK